MSAACVSITIACGLVPLFEIRADRPATVLQRENAGPSTSMRRLRTRIATTLVGASAATAVALGVLGLHRAMADSLRRRRREVGVRIALGAPARYVIGQVVSEGARLAAAGTVVGMLASIMVARC